MAHPARSTFFFLAAALALASAPATVALAATATSTLGVRVVVQPSCTVSGATLDFGTYTSGQTTALTGFTQIAYSNCPAGQLRFQLDGGTNGTATARKLGNGGGGALLNYGIFRDSARTQNFGQAGDSRLVTLTAAGSGNISVYGRIPAGQSVAAGTYTDTVVITLDF
jgi:spore coat protein U-like protein